MNRKNEIITILKNSASGPRISFGLDRLTQTLKAQGCRVREEELPQRYEDYRKIPGRKLYAAVCENDPFIQWLIREELLVFHTEEPKGEGFYIETCPALLTAVTGGTDTGVLYGLTELRERVEKEGHFPHEITFGDAPVLS